MNQIHAANRRHWDGHLAEVFQKHSEAAKRWQRCSTEPELAFDCEALQVIDEFVGELTGKKVCLVGSGDNHAAFALAGLGAHLTSVDQSAKQLETASRRASKLGLPITFTQADATDMGTLPSTSFDLVCSTNGFFVWLADLPRLFAEIQRLLKPGGFYIFYDIHPFQRPWKNDTLEMEKPYFETGPIHPKDEGPYFFHWTMGDVLNALADGGLALRRLKECPARDSANWLSDHYYKPGASPELLDWRINPLTGLPYWLLVAAEKKGIDD